MLIFSAMIWVYSFYLFIWLYISISVWLHVCMCACLYVGLSPAQKKDQWRRCFCVQSQGSRCCQNPPKLIIDLSAKWGLANPFVSWGQTRTDTVEMPNYINAQSRPNFVVINEEGSERGMIIRVVLFKWLIFCSNSRRKTRKQETLTLSTCADNSIGSKNWPIWVLFGTPPPF